MVLGHKLLSLLLFKFSDPPGVPNIAGWAFATIKVGQTLTLNCEWNKNKGPPTSYEWYRDDVKLVSTGPLGETYTEEVKDKSASGLYKCKAINADGSAEATRRITVKG